MNFKKRVNGSWTDTPYYIHNTSTDTITTLPADLYTDGQSATVGLVGNMAQSGTPSPTTPIQPQECGERTGNLCSNIAYKTNYSINAQGVETATTGFNIYSIFCNPNTTYTISLKSPLGGTTVRIHTYNNGVWIEQTKTAPLQDLPLTFTTPNNADEIRVSITNGANGNIMLNTGSTALPYEPYGYKIPISSAGQTTPVYLGEVQSTRQIKKLVLTGDESIIYSSVYTRFSISIPDFETMGVRITPFVMSHYIVIDDGRSLSDVPNNAAYSGAASDNHIIFIKTTSFTSSDDFKAYLATQYAAGTPVCVWYVLATPTTGIVNEPLMKIGEYADTVSDISIPVAAGGDTISVGTTLQPSEVTVNYKGWHPVADVHERDNGAWT